MYRVIKSSIQINRSLPTLDKAIHDYQNTEFFKDCKFEYFIEDDGEPNTLLVFLHDVNEVVGAYEFYELASVDRMIRRFEQAIAQDFNDPNFTLDPYDRIAFCGRVRTDG